VCEDLLTEAVGVGLPVLLPDELLDDVLDWPPLLLWSLELDGDQLQLLL